LRVLAVESFLADIAQNVAGDRFKVDMLLPIGADPHEYQLTPKDVARLSEADVLLINGVHYEGFLETTLENTDSQHLVITASNGITLRTNEQGQDPHLWMDPKNVIRYTENIRDGLTQADPAGAEIYTANAKAYIQQLKALDAWVSEQINEIPSKNRLLVTNHDSLGYFAQRYGFTVIGTIVPGFSSEASSSAQQMATLIEQIKSTGAPAVFLNISDSPHLADQVAEEAKVTVVTDLYIESLSSSDGAAATYIDMLKHDVTQIVEALK
jgi:manganese/iron transport system substrate-binding protein